MGFNAQDFVGVVTSGEVTHQHLLERPTPSWQQLGHRCLHFTWGSRGAVSLEGLGLQVRPHITRNCLLQVAHFAPIH